MDKILIIEDDALIREELALLLANQGYEAKYVIDFADVPGQVRDAVPDLILLDINLPGQDGYQICTAIRSFCATPILFLTGRSTAMDELQALTLGGDDYVSKPCNIPVLLARIGLLLKRGRTDAKSDAKSGILEYKGLSLNPVTATLTKGSQSMELTKTELKILHYLFRHPGEIVPRPDLVEYLWDNEIHMDDNALSVNVIRLRGKLSDLGETDFIQTKRGMGYRI